MNKHYTKPHKSTDYPTVHLFQLQQKHKQKQKPPVAGQHMNLTDSKMYRLDFL